MRRGVKRVALGLLILLVLAQLIRPERSNPATEPSRTIRSQSAELASILDRSCGDCHSSRTVWPWYSQIAPLSWVMAYGVKAGRKAVNFSEWTGYSPEQQRTLLDQSCRDVSDGKMPGGAWISLHPEARLSAQEIVTICRGTRGPAMTIPDVETRIHDFLAQRRIAVAGVSRNDGQHPAATLIFNRLKKTGHDVFPVNPNLPTFEGQACYPNLQSIPGGIDGVVIVTRPEVTEQIVRDCSSAGVRRVWMHQSAARGSSVSQAAVDYCRQHDISVIAGACPMMYGDGVDFGHRCMRWMLKFSRLPA